MKPFLSGDGASTMLAAQRPCTPLVIQFELLHSLCWGKSPKLALGEAQGGLQSPDAIFSNGLEQHRGVQTRDLRRSVNGVQPSIFSVHPYTYSRMQPPHTVGDACTKATCCDRFRRDKVQPPKHKEDARLPTPSQYLILIWYVYLERLCLTTPTRP